MVGMLNWNKKPNQNETIVELRPYILVKDRPQQHNIIQSLWRVSFLNVAMDPITS